MKKKVLSMALAGLMLVTMLAGCGEAQTGEGTEATEKTEKTEKIVKLQWYYPGPGEIADQEKVQEAVNAYTKEKIRVEVEMHCLDWANYQQKVDQMIAAGEEFDICWTAGWMGYTNNAAKGAYLELDELADTYAPNTKALFEEKYLDTIRVKGKLYAIPTNTDKAANFGILYRRDLAEKHNIDFSKVKTYEDVLPILKEIQEKEPDITPFSTSSVKFPADNRLGVLDDSNLNGYIRNDDPSDNKVYNLLESKEFMDMCKVMRAINQGGYMRKDALTYQDFDSDDNNGKTFMCFAKLKPGVENEITGAALVPEVVWAQHSLTEPIFGNGSASMTSISRTSKHQEAAMKFIELLNTDKYMADLMNYGIEGEHYKRVDDKFIEPVPNSGYAAWVGQQWVLCNQYNVSLLPGEDPDKWVKMDEFNAKATYGRNAGFVFDNSKVKTQVAAVTNINESMLDAIKLGEVDPEKEIPALREKLKAAGEDEIIAEMQRQWDEYIAAQAE